MRQRWTISSTRLASFACRWWTDGTIEAGLCCECWWLERIERAAVERERAGDHLEEHDTEGVDVGADVNRPGVAELLGRHVSPGAQPRTRAGQARVESFVRGDVLARLLVDRAGRWKLLASDGALPRRRRAGHLVDVARPHSPFT